MKLRTWIWHVREAIMGIRRNGVMSVASLGTVAISLLVLAGVVLTALNLQHLATVLDQQTEVVAYLKPDFDRQWTKVLLEKAQAIPGVAQVRFVSKEEALARLKQQFGSNSSLLDGVDQNNPLPDMLEVQVVASAQVKSVSAGLRGIESVDKVDYRQDVLKNVAALTRALRLAGVGLIGLLLVVTLFIISNTIRITVFARRREIGIMRMVGATNAFIRAPFLIEGALLGLGGAVLATVIVSWAYRWLVQAVASNLPFVPLLAGDGLLWRLAESLLILGAVVGAAGSGLSMRRYLKA